MFDVEMTITAYDSETGKPTGGKTWRGNGLTARERNAVNREFNAAENRLLDLSDKSAS